MYKAANTDQQWLFISAIILGSFKSEITTGY